MTTFFTLSSSLSLSLSLSIVCKREYNDIVETGRCKARVRILLLRLSGYFVMQHEWVSGLVAFSYHGRIMMWNKKKKKKMLMASNCILLWLWWGCLSLELRVLAEIHDILNMFCCFYELFRHLDFVFQNHFTAEC